MSTEHQTLAVSSVTSHIAELCSERCSRTYPRFMETIFFTMFTRARHVTLSYVSPLLIHFNIILPFTPVSNRISLLLA
jgi:hypothetical protein